MYGVYVGYIYGAPVTCFSGCFGHIMLTNWSVLTHKGKENPIVFPSQWRSTDRRERVYGADIYMLSARLPVFVKLKAFFSHLCKILSFLCPAGKWHVITVVPKQDKWEAFKIGLPNFCVLCSFTIEFMTLNTALIHTLDIEFSFKFTFDSECKHG